MKESPLIGCLPLFHSCPPVSKFIQPRDDRIGEAFQGLLDHFNHLQRLDQLFAGWLTSKAEANDQNGIAKKCSSVSLGP
jgi:hypothetical protein